MANKLVNFVFGEDKPASLPTNDPYVGNLKALVDSGKVKIKTGMWTGGKADFRTALSKLWELSSKLEGL